MVVLVVMMDGGASGHDGADDNVSASDIPFRYYFDPFVSFCRCAEEEMAMFMSCIIKMKIKIEAHIDIIPCW